MTGSMKDRAAEITALEHLLETHGADRTRWPAPVRLRFAGLLAEDRAAHAKFAAAQALDRLIDCAPRVSPARETALVAKIMAASLREGRPVALARPVVGGQAADGQPAAVQAVSRTPDDGAAKATMIAVPGAGSAQSMVRRGAGQGARRSDGLRMTAVGQWPAAGLLAASLVLGIVIGGAGLTGPLVKSIAAAAGIVSEADSGQVASAEPGLGADALTGEEDTL